MRVVVVVEQTQFSLHNVPMNGCGVCVVDDSFQAASAGSESNQYDSGQGRLL